MNIAECFSLGVPVVSTRIGNAGDLVSKSNAGTLFDFEVKGSFRKALDAVYEQRNFRLMLITITCATRHLLQTMKD
jgi:hypothetical protein